MLWRVYALQFRNRTIAVAQPDARAHRTGGETACRYCSAPSLLLPLLPRWIWLSVA